MLELPKLKFEVDSLEPIITKETIETHHGKHHRAYTNNFNALIEKYPVLGEYSTEDLFLDLDLVPSEAKTAFINNGGGYLNHSFYFSLLNKPNSSQISDTFEFVINEAFESLDKFKDLFEAEAMSVFGSGWTWLVLDNDELVIVNTKNQESPLMDGQIPIFCIDVWEHAYYIDHRNLRVDYVKSFWDVVDWDQVEKNYLAAL